MEVIRAGFSILTPIDPDSILTTIEAAGRTCYKSEKNITPASSFAFVKNLIARGHDSVLEHQSISVRVVCDRGVSHEIVRHRIASYSQESTRFCNYANAGSVVFIQPCFWTPDSINYRTWEDFCKRSELAYLDLIARGSSPQEARSVLPNSLKTEIVITMNLREWRHFFKLRAEGTAGKPHPQMLEISVPMLAEFRRQIPAVFDDILA